MKRKKIVSIILLTFTTISLISFNGGVKVQAAENVSSEITQDSDYTSLDHFSYMIKNGETVLITSYSGSDEVVKIPNEIEGKPVTEIAERVFYYNRTLKKVVIPDNVVTIHTDAFGYCQNLESVEFGKGVTYIGAYAFSWCPSLKEINIPASVRYIRMNAFQRCEGLEKVNFSEGIIGIDKLAFHECTSLKQVNLPQTLETIEEGAFAATNLKEIVIPENVISIGTRAFAFTYNLKDITLLNADTEIKSDSFDDGMEGRVFHGYKVSTTKDYADANNEVFRALDGDMLNIDSLTANPESVQAGTPVKITSEAVGSGMIKYRFVVLKDGVNVYTRGYKESNNTIWTPAESGNYQIVCKATDETGEVVSKTIDYTVNKKDLAIKDLKIRQSGGKIVIGATAEGDGNLLYRFVVLKNGVNVYTRGYKNVNYTTWKPSEPGNYQIICKVKDKLGNEVSKSISYFTNSL